MLLTSIKNPSNFVYTTTSNPTVNNDIVDTAGIGRTFPTGSFWLNSSAGQLFISISSTAGAALWRRDAIFQTDGSLITDSADGWVTIGASAFPNKPAFTDSNGIALVSSININKGLISELDGDLLGYGINVPQFGDRDQDIIGALLRLDTRDTYPALSIMRYPVGSSVANFDLQVKADGKIALGGWGEADSVNSIVNIKSSDPAVPVLSIYAHSTQTADLTRWHNNAGTIIGTFTNAGLLTIKAFALDNGFYSTTATVTTTNNTVTTVYTLNVATNTCYYLKVMAVCSRTDSINESAVFEKLFMVKDVSGTITLSAVGIANISRDTLAGTVDVTADVSSTTVRIRVTGETSKTLKWSLKVEHQVAQ